MSGGKDLGASVPDQAGRAPHGAAKASPPSGDHPSRRRYSDEGPMCPHCGTLYTPDEPFFYDEMRFTRMDCDECGNVFAVEVYTSTSWTTTAIATEAAPAAETAQTGSVHEGVGRRYRPHEGR